MTRAAHQYVGPVVSAFAVLAGIAVGQALRPSVCAEASGVLWASGVALLLAAIVARPLPAACAWVVPTLLGYALVIVAAQPSARTDGNATAAVVGSALCLVPAVAGGVALPRAGRWAAAAGCWCLLLGLTAAASGTVWHPSASVGIFVVVWD